MALLDAVVRGEAHVDAQCQLLLGQVGAQPCLPNLLADLPSPGEDPVRGRGQIGHSLTLARP